ncbi:cytochrome-c peroxidase [Hydrogenimonas sp.]
MRTFAIVALIVMGLLVLYFNGFFIPPPSQSYRPPSASELREEALRRGLRPVPATWREAREAVANPNNPLNPEKIALGQRLYFDPILSKDRTINCASCHILEEGGDDNRPTAIGYHGQPNPKHLNSPTVLNAALAKRQFWDGRAKDVEAQAKGPIQAPFEMAMTPEEVVARLEARPDYVEAFADVFGGEGITFDHVADAIGAYERTLLTRGAFDRFLEGDDEALGPEARAGLNLFMRIGCKGCHGGMSVGGQSLQRFPLRRYNSLLVPSSRFVDGERWFAGFRWQKPRGDEPYPFPDIGGFHGAKGQYLFRVPILRNITRTAPYFHNGSVEKIDEAVRIMARHQLGLELSDAQVQQLVAFLKSLEGDPVPYEIR